MTTRLLTFIVSLLLVTVVACASDDGTLDIESIRDGVFTIQGDARTQVSAPEHAKLAVGDSIDVDTDGRAFIRFPDLLTVEVLRDGELVLQELAIDEQSAFIRVAQRGGVLVNGFSASKNIERRFTVETEFATITATGTQFVVAYEQSGDQIWVLAQNAAEDDLLVEAAGATQSVTSGMASSVREGEPPSDPVPYDTARLESWLNGLRDTGEAEFDIAGVVLGAPTVVLELSDTHDGRTVVGGEIDKMYEFSAPAGSVITVEFDVTDVADEFSDPQVYLRDIDGAYPGNHDYTYTDDQRHHVIRQVQAHDSDGTFAVLVRQVFGSSSYDLRVTAQQQLDGGRLGDAGDTFETAVPITIGSGTTYRGLLGHEDSEDNYRFSADAGTRIAIEASIDASYRHGVVVELVHRTSGERLLWFVPSPEHPGPRTVTLERGGDYLLTVSSHGQQEYAFSLRAAK